MGIAFTGTAGDRINYGGGGSGSAALDNLSTFTFILWIRPNATGQNAGLFSKGTAAGSNRRSLELRTSVTATAVYCVVDGATNDANAETGANAYAANVWLFIASTFAGSGAPKIYLGTEAAAPTDQTSTTATLGGALGDNSANDQFCFAYGAGTTGNPNADIGFVGAWNVEMTANQVAGMWRKLSRTRVPGNVLYSVPGWGGVNARDWSSSGLHGTLTGGALTSNPAILSPFGDEWRGGLIIPSAAAAASTSRFLPLLGVG